MAFKRSGVRLPLAPPFLQRNQWLEPKFLRPQVWPDDWSESKASAMGQTITLRQHVEHLQEAAKEPPRHLQPVVTA